MSIRIPKVDARPAGGPGESAFHRNAALGEFRLPGWQTFSWDAEADVTLPAAAVRWNETKGQGCPVRIAATAKQNQHLAPFDAERTKAIIRSHDRIAEKAGVELTRAHKIGHMKTGFQDGAGEHRLGIHTRTGCHSAAPAQRGSGGQPHQSATVRGSHRAPLNGAEA